MSDLVMSSSLMSLGVGLGIGLVAGIVSGMLGVGGGLVNIPGSVLLLRAGQHTAHGASLAVVVVTAIVGAIIHNRQGNVKLDIALWAAPSAAIFSFAGASLAGIIDAHLLSRIFGLLLLIVGGRIVLRV